MAKNKEIGCDITECCQLVGLARERNEESSAFFRGLYETMMSHAVENFSDPDRVNEHICKIDLVKSAMGEREAQTCLGKEPWILDCIVGSDSRIVAISPNSA